MRRESKFARRKEEVMTKEMKRRRNMKRTFIGTLAALVLAAAPAGFAEDLWTDEELLLLTGGESGEGEVIWEEEYISEEDCSDAGVRLFGGDSNAYDAGVEWEELCDDADEWVVEEAIRLVGSAGPDDSDDDDSDDDDSDDDDSDDDDGDDDDEDGRDGDDSEKESELIRRVVIACDALVPRAYFRPTYKMAIESGNAEISYACWMGSNGTANYSNSAAYRMTDRQFTKFSERVYYTYSVCIQAKDDDYFSNETWVIVNGQWLTGSDWTLSSDCKRIYIREIGSGLAECMHELVSTVKKETCTTDGYTKKSCKYCSYSEVTNRVPATNHDFSLDEGEDEEDSDRVTVQEATCTCSGQKIIRCRRCSEETYEFIYALNHDWKLDAKNSQRSTCTTAGYDVFVCANCDEELRKTTGAATGHRFTTLKVDEAATAEENGYYHYNCANDDCEEEGRDNTIFRIGTIRLSSSSFVYNGNAQSPTVRVYDVTGKEVSAQNYQVTCYGNVNAGTATVHVRFSGTWYDGVMEKNYTIKKASQTVTAKNASMKYKKSALAKKKQTFSIEAKASGKLTYKSGNTKYVTVTSAGKVTVKKGTPKGTYKITVSAAATTNYTAASKTITIKVS